MKQAIIFLFFIFLATQCSERPSYKIEDKKMINMLVDIHIADVMYKIKTLPPRYEQSDTALYTDIFDKYNVSKKQFDTTMNYYITHNPKKLNVIYDSVINRLSWIEGEIEKEKEKEKEDEKKEKKKEK